MGAASDGEYGPRAKGKQLHDALWVSDVVDAVTSVQEPTAVTGAEPLAAGRAPGTRLPSPRVALRAVGGPFWNSRSVVLLSGLFASVKVGTAGLKLTNFGSLLLAPSLHWDDGWYLDIAQSGYGNVQARGMFPLYPLLIRAVGLLIGITYAAVIISLVALFVALLLLYRLTELDFSPQVAATTVALVAFCPMAFFFSAVYTESLFLALSVGAIYAARRERWLVAGILGALASATRNSGVLLILPILLLYLYGPRGSESAARANWPTPRLWLQKLLPRYRLTWRIWPVLLVPLGVGAYTLYLALKYHDGFEWISVQRTYWLHTSSNPIGGFVQGADTAWSGLRDLIAHPGGRNAASPDATNILNFVACLAGLVALVGCLRNLPIGYSAYAAAAFLLPLMTPTQQYPLNSVPRYQMVIFPLFIWAAQYLERRRWSTTAIAGSAVLLGMFTAMYAVGPWIA